MAKTQLVVLVILITAAVSLTASAENQSTERTCSSDGFDAWLVESETSEYPIEIRGCQPDNLEQINVMIGFDDGTTSYQTVGVTSSGINCESDTCDAANVDYTEHTDQNYNFTIRLTSGKEPENLFSPQPIEVDVDLLALDQYQPRGWAGDTDSGRLAEACQSNEYSCVSSNSYKADLVAKVGLRTGYESGDEITLKDGNTVRFPDGCDYQASYVHRNRPLMKVWHSSSYTTEEPLTSGESFETSEGTRFQISSVDSGEVSFSASCPDWNGGSDNQSEEEGTTWINYCYQQNSGSLSNPDNIVSCMSSCYGAPPDQSAEGSDSSTCGEVVESFCSFADGSYDSSNGEARCS